MSTILTKCRYSSVIFLLCAGLIISTILWFNGFMHSNNHNMQSPDADKVIINIAIADGTINLDPKFATDATSTRILRLISPSLVELDEKFTPTSKIANFKQLRPTVWQFELNPDIKFQDGTNLTAEWLASFFNDIIDPKTASPLKGALQYLQHVDAIDDKVIFKLNKPAPLFLSTLDIPLVKMSDIGLPIGVGDYILEGINAQNNIHLKSNKKSIPDLMFKVVKDPMVRVLKVLNGEVDVIINDLPIELYDYTISKQSAGVTGVSKASASYTYIGFNFQNSAKTASPILRQAIAYGVDLESIRKILLGGKADIANSLLMPSHPAFYNADEVKHNPVMAQKLLTQYKQQNNLLQDEVVGLNLSITTNPFILRVAQVLQAQLQEVGIRLNISSSEWGTFYANIKKGNFESYILTWVGRFGPDIFPYLFHSKNIPPVGANRGRFVNDQMDNLLDKMQNSSNINDLYSLAKKVQKLQAENIIYIPLWRKHNMLLMGNGVSDCKLTADGGFTGLTNCKKHLVN